MDTIKNIRITFWVQAAITATAIILFETGVMPTGCIQLSPTAQYTSEVAGIMLTISLIPLAIKGFSAQMRRAAEQNMPHFNEYFRSKSNARLSILFFVTIMNIVLYYGMGNDKAFYCALFGIIATIYSYPTQGALNNYTQEKQ